MGIRSTQHISRTTAINRIFEIDSLATSRNYNSIDKVCFDPDCSIKDFVDSYIPIDKDLNNWTNEMLSDKMDEPFFRFSMFDNYLISE